MTENNLGIGSKATVLNNKLVEQAKEGGDARVKYIADRTATSFKHICISSIIGSFVQLDRAAMSIHSAAATCRHVVG